MKFTSLLIVFASLISQQAVLADEINVAGKFKMKVQTNDFVTPRETVLSLIRTDRYPREMKFLKLVPGEEKTWFYTYLMEDGSVITKEASHKLEGVRDERELKESHPNRWVAKQILEFIIPSSLTGITALVAVKK